MKKIIVLMLAVVPFVCNAQQPSLTVTFTDIKTDSGKVMVALFQGKTKYETKEDFRADMLRIKKGRAVWVVDSLPDGEYLITAFHDENGNGKMETGKWNIPEEGFAFSNNVQPQMGPPNVSNMLFKVENGKTEEQIIKMVYFDFSLFGGK